MGSPLVDVSADSRPALCRAGREVGDYS